VSFIHKFQLRLLLLATSLLLLRAKNKSMRLRNMFCDPAFIFQIQTDDGVAGHFELQDHALRFRFGTHWRPTFVQRWKDSREAVSVMLNKDETEILRAMEDGRCRLKGSFLIGMWFNEAVKIARSV
jgi:hypothetical protein